MLTLDPTLKALHVCAWVFSPVYQAEPADRLGHVIFMGCGMVSESNCGIWLVKKLAIFSLPGKVGPPDGACEHAPCEVTPFEHPLTGTSAICTAFSAAPLPSLSQSSGLSLGSGPINGSRLMTASSLFC